MEERAREAAQRLSESDFVRIATHIDSDGVGAGALAKIALDRAGISNEILLLKNLPPEDVEGVTAGLPEGGVLWLCDLGAAVLGELEGTPCIITDHHRPKYPSTNVAKEKRGDLMAFAEEVESSDSTVIMLNPHEFGIDGGREISGAGTTYLVARELGGDNTDLAVFAVVGAVGDIQTPDNRLISMNRTILEEAVDNGHMQVEEDLIFYGRETRDAVQLLSRASEPPIPSLFGEPVKTKELLEHLGIDYQREDESVKHWTELVRDDRKKIISALTKLFLVLGEDPSTADKITGEVYVKTGEPVGSPMRDAKEISTLLNACGRYGHFETALRICNGERGEVLDQALELMWDHRANLVKFISSVLEKGFTDRASFTYFDAGDRIPEEVVGIVLGILMSGDQIDRTRPVFAFADSAEKGRVKISARASRRLVVEGLDLSQVMKECCAAAGGSGGGHNAAAGGSINRDRLSEFLDILDKELA